jgi:hypothetical protein
MVIQSEVRGLVVYNKQDEPPLQRRTNASSRSSRQSAQVVEGSAAPFAGAQAAPCKGTRSRPTAPKHVPREHEPRAAHAAQLDHRLRRDAHGRGRGRKSRLAHRGPQKIRAAAQQLELINNILDTSPRWSRQDRPLPRALRGAAHRERGRRDHRAAREAARLVGSIAADLGEMYADLTKLRQSLFQPPLERVRSSPRTERSRSSSRGGLRRPRSSRSR